MDAIVRTVSGEYDLEASIKSIGDDLLIAVYGGERPHIGAVAVAQPRPSLKDPDITSSTASVFCFLSHKEDEIAKLASETISAAFKTNVVVTAGMHWDGISEDGLKKVGINSRDLVVLIIDKIKLSFSTVL